MANAVSKTLRKFGFQGDADLIDSLSGKVKRKVSRKPKKLTVLQQRLQNAKIRRAVRKAKASAYRAARNSRKK